MEQKTKVRATETTRIKDWYCEQYPTDELGFEIDSEITFYDLFRVLDAYGDVYEAMGVGDSIIRERAFEKLAEIMGVEYDYIYEQWLRA